MAAVADRHSDGFDAVFGSRRGGPNVASVTARLLAGDDLQAGLDAFAQMVVHDDFFDGRPETMHKLSAAFVKALLGRVREEWEGTLRRTLAVMYYDDSTAARSRELIDYAVDDVFADAAELLVDRLTSDPGAVYLEGGTEAMVEWACEEDGLMHGLGQLFAPKLVGQEAGLLMHILGDDEFKQLVDATMFDLDQFTLSDVLADVPEADWSETFRAIPERHAELGGSPGAMLALDSLGGGPANLQRALRLSITHLVRHQAERR